MQGLVPKLQLSPAQPCPLKSPMWSHVQDWVVLTVAVEAGEAVKGITELRGKVLPGLVQVAQWGDRPAAR